MGNKILSVIILSTVYCFPQVIGNYYTQYHPQDIDVSGSHAYFSIGNSIHVLDISYPASPEYIRELDLGSSIYDITVSGQYALVACPYRGLVIIDISDPESLSVSGECAGVYALGVAAPEGDFAYVTYGYPGIGIVDIRDPGNPALVGTLATADYARYIAVKDKYAFIAVDRAGILTVDITDPSNPVQAGVYGTQQSKYWRISLVKDYLYASDTRDTAIHIFDTSHPEALKLVGEYHPGNFANEVIALDDVAYFTADSRCLHVIDVSEPALPIPVSKCVISGLSADMTVKNDHAYLTFYNLYKSGIQIVDLKTVRADFRAFADLPDSALEINYNSAYILSSDPDSFGIWYKNSGFIDSASDPAAEFLGVLPATDSAISFKTQLYPDSTCYIGLFVKDSSGAWSHYLNSTAVNRYDYSHDSMIVSEILHLNGLAHIPVTAVADTLNGRVVKFKFRSWELGGSLDSLPGSIGSLYHLDTLDLMGNNLKSLPDEIVGLDDIDVLELASNQLYLKGAVKNWAVTYDDDYQMRQSNNKNRLSIINQPRTFRHNGFIQKAVLVVEPKSDRVENSLYLSYTDNGNFNGHDTTLLEIDHMFRLPDSAVVNDLWLWMGDSVMQALMFDKNRAQDIYDSIVRPPRAVIDPAILEKDGAYYDLRVFPLISADLARIKLTYILPAGIQGDSASVQVPLEMLDLDNNIIKPLSILFKEQIGSPGHAPALKELPGVSFAANRDTAGYRYSLAQVDDITELTELAVTYRPDSADSDPKMDALMVANDNINVLLAQNPQETLAVIDSSKKYNLLTDFTALLVLEPNDTFRFLKEPLDEDEFVPDPPPFGIDDVVPGMLDSISFAVNPNPFHNTVDFTFTLKRSSNIRLEIFNVDGSLMALLMNGRRNASRTRVTWNGIMTGAPVQPGIYYYRLTKDGNSIFGRLIKIGSQ